MHSNTTVEFSFPLDECLAIYRREEGLLVAI